MNRFLRPISVVALLQELVIFGSLIFTATFLGIYEKMDYGRWSAPWISSLLRNFWPVLALIPLAWILLVARDEKSDVPRFDERQHFWMGVGFLILWALFGLTASFAAFNSYDTGPIQSPW